MVIWFTGLPGSGKTTLSDALTRDLETQGLEVEHLDGDRLRKIFPKTGFSRKERDNHIRRTAEMAKDLEKSGKIVVVSLIAPYETSRQFARSVCRRFIEIYVSTPLAVCEKRDPKGLYAKARRGEIKQFTGIDDPYETPSNPELNIDTSVTSLANALSKIKAYADFKKGSF